MSDSNQEKETSGMFKGYRIVRKCAVISEEKGITKELNLIDYGKKEPVYDIRKWNRNYSKAEREMLKGITFTRREMKILRDEINKLNLE